VSAPIEAVVVSPTKVDLRQYGSSVGVIEGVDALDLAELVLAWAGPTWASQSEAA
jgi:hypothetical protein